MASTLTGGPWSEELKGQVREMVQQGGEGGNEAETRAEAELQRRHEDEEQPQREETLDELVLLPWYYQDSQGVIQGPFGARQMRQKLLARHFNTDFLFRQGNTLGQFFPLIVHFCSFDEAFVEPSELVLAFLASKASDQQVQQQQQQQQQPGWGAAVSHHPGGALFGNSLIGSSPAAGGSQQQQEQQRGQPSSAVELPSIPTAYFTPPFEPIPSDERRTVGGSPDAPGWSDQEIQGWPHRLTERYPPGVFLAHRVVPDGAPPPPTAGRRPRQDDDGAATSAPVPPPGTRPRRLDRQQPGREDDSPGDGLAAMMANLVLQHRRSRGELFYARPRGVYWKRVSVSIEFIEFDRGTVPDNIFEHSNDRTQPQNCFVRIQIGAGVNVYTFATATPAPPSSLPRATVTNSLNFLKIFATTDPFPEGQDEVPATVSLGCDANGVGGVVQPNCLIFYKDPTDEDETANLTYRLVLEHQSNQSGESAGGGGAQSDSHPDGINHVTATSSGNYDCGALSSSRRRPSLVEHSLARSTRALCGQLLSRGRRDLVQRLEHTVAETDLSLVRHEIFLALWARSVAEVIVSHKLAGAPPNLAELIRAFLGYDDQAKLADDYGSERVLTTAAKNALSRWRRRQQEEEERQQQQQSQLADETKQEVSGSDEDDVDTKGAAGEGRQLLTKSDNGDKCAAVPPLDGEQTSEAMLKTVDQPVREVVDEPGSKRRLDYHGDDDDDCAEESAERTHEASLSSSETTVVPGYNSKGAGPSSTPTSATGIGETN